MQNNNRHELWYLARPKCPRCGGSGADQDSAETCACVAVECARQVFSAYADRAASRGYSRHSQLVRIERASGPVGRRSCGGYKTENFLADVFLVCKRNTTPREFEIVKSYFLEPDAHWSEGARKLGNVSKRVFFYAASALEQKLGRVFRELRPFPLWPLESYFSNVAPGHKVLPSIPQPVAALAQPVTVPVLRTEVKYSGTPGITWDNSKQKWRAMVRRRYVGFFANLGEAKRARAAVLDEQRASLAA